ncbi:Disease resistance protein RPP8 [Forsythia ovata]|uniref:Disease resistance protein RPP8 n=1 Tax=Forsythia ovata TaxID=205694 RepID=A0ABD1PH01_9LAMI
MAESVVFCAIQHLGELLIREAQFLHGIHGQLENIHMKLRRLQCISKIADARQDEDERIREWVAETRKVAYDAEDCLEIFAVEIASREEHNVLRRYACLLKEVTSLLHLGPKIQDVEAKISDLETDLRVRHISSTCQGEISSPRSERREQLRRSYSHHEEDFVGLEEDVEKLVAELVNEDGGKCYHVLSITGMGGIGKTALARKVYHHADVRSHFHALAWVCISRQWHPEGVLQQILNKLVPERREQINKINNIAELVKELFEVQKWKKCLVVLDDVWEKDVWSSLRPAFPNRKLVSRVIVTTRNKEIAHHLDTDTTCFLYEQRFLNEKESWELLQKKAFAGTNISGKRVFGFEHEDARLSTSSTDSFHSCSSDMEEDEAMCNPKMLYSEDGSQERKNQIDMEKLGKEMVGQCGGLPLAIVVLGGLLMTKSTLSEWKTVHQNFNSLLRRGTSLGENGRVYEVLALSYHDLPYQVKPCFLHLGNFPEDYKISTRKLYQLWAAEGFIFSDSYQAEEEESIMDVAERYLHELKQRCMVQVQVEESSGQFKSCQLHDLTRELCLLKGKEENFLQRIPFSQEPELVGSRSSSSRTTSASVTRRLSVTVDSDFETYFPPKQENLNRVRSALFFSRLTDRKLNISLSLLCNAFKLLRVLDLERFDFGRKLSDAIGNLIHLRYLSLRGSQFYRLPSSIGNLKFLQTLDLRVPFLVCLTIPDVIWKLNNLRHLYLPPSHKSRGKLQLGTLSKLEILKNFDTRVSDFSDIPKLTRLQKLSAILSLEMKNMEAINSYFRTNSNRLRDSSFRVRYDFQSDRDSTLLGELVGYTHLRKMDLIGCLNKLPEHSHFSERLTTLTLRNSKLEEDPMAVLEKLPRLYSLVLRRHVFLGTKIHCSSTGFCQLRTFELQGQTSLENWRIERGAMPNLQYLKIDECVNLKMVPEGTEFVTTIRELVIANMPEDFKRRVQMVQEEGGEDFYKVEHIPSITYIDTIRGELENQLEGLDFLTAYSFSVFFIGRNWCFWTSSKFCSINSTKGMEGPIMCLAGYGKTIVQKTDLQVTRLQVDEAKLLYDVSIQVEEIQVEFKRTQCFLNDADARKDEDKTVRNWVSEIREVAYDVEDVLETFSIKVMLKKEKGVLVRYAGILKEGIALHHVGSEIQKIKAKISSLTSSLQSYGIKAISQGENSNSTSQKCRQLRRT